MDEKTAECLTYEQLKAISYIKRMGDEQIRLVFDKLGESLSAK